MAMEPEIEGAEFAQQKKKSRIGWTILFILFNIIIVGSTAYVEFSKERPDPLGIRFGWRNIASFCLAIGALAVVLAAETSKYLLMMHALGEKVSVKNAFQVAALGKYYDSLTPTGAGGQPFQIWFLHSRGYSGGASAAMPLAAFLGMQFAFILLGLLAFIFKGSVIESPAIQVSARIGMLCYMIVPVLLVIFALNQKAAEKIIRFFVKVLARIRIFKDPEQKEAKIIEYFSNYRNNLISITRKKYLPLWLLLISLVYQIALCSIPYFVLHGYGGKTTYIDVLAMTVFIYAAITIIPTPGNSGAAEGSFYLVFSALGASGLFWSMLIWRFLCYYSFIIIGLLIFSYNMLSNRRIIRCQHDENLRLHQKEGDSI